MLIAFLQLLIHVDKEVRLEYFQDLRACFTKKSKTFKVFLDYFERNWLKNAFIDFKSCDEEELQDRTNNICEGFNRVFNQHIKIRRASLAIFVCKLKELEFHYRKKVLKNIGNGEQNIKVEESLSDKLPFTKIYAYLENLKSEVENVRYSLRSGQVREEFMNSLVDLSQNCYDYFYSEDNLGNEEPENGKFIYFLY